MLCDGSHYDAPGIHRKEYIEAVRKAVSSCKSTMADPEYRDKVKVAKEATRQRKMESNATPSASESYKDISPLSEKSDAIHTAGNEDNA